MDFDFGNVAVPFRMQPGLRKLEGPPLPFRTRANA